MSSLLLALLCTAAPGQARVEANAPVLLVLRTSEAVAKREERLYEEVGLLLDSFMVMAQPVDDAQFQQRPLADQLARAIALANQEGAVAALWVAEPVRGQLMLHVVGIGVGRAVIRTLEFDRKSGSEKALALIVRELLGTAFIAEPVGTLNPQLTQVVREVRRELPPDPVLEKPPPPLSPARSGWVVSAGGSIGAALEGGVTSSYTAGAHARVERRLGESFSAGLQAELHAARSRPLDGTAVDSLEVPLGVTAGLRLAAGPLALVPRAAALVGFDRVWATTPTDRAVTTVATLRARLGLELGSAGAGPFQVTAGFFLDWLPWRGEVRDEGTGTTLWRAPRFEAQATATIAWEG